MDLSAHTMTAPQVRALAEGTSTPAALGVLVAGQRSKCLAMLALTVRAATEARHPEAEVAALGWRLLTRVQQHAPQAVEELLRYPAVGAWATTSVLALGSAVGNSASPGRRALVAAAAAIRGDVACTIEVPPSGYEGRFLHLPSLGSAVLPRPAYGKTVILRHQPPVTEIVGDHATVSLPRDLDISTPEWRALEAVTIGANRTPLRLVIDDADPCRLPGYEGPLDRLTAGQRDEWRRRISGGWQMLSRHHPQTATEVLSLIGTVVPLRGARDVTRSITTRHVFGSVGLSLPGDDVAMALTLAHEVQHAKLAALMDLLPLIAGPESGRYYAPWRPDPRPLASLLQGMYAHLGVARFWRRHREVMHKPSEVHHAYVEFARWQNACIQVAKVVSARPELTRCGTVFVDGVIRVLRGWRHEYIPPAAQAQADQASSAHRRKWEIDIGALENEVPDSA
jgi:HEXXH motif-containing protein